MYFWLCFQVSLVSEWRILYTACCIMSVKVSKPTKGQWIVKLEKLNKCKDCPEFFINSLSFKNHIKVHKDEGRTKTEYQERKCQGTSKSKLSAVYKQIFNENGEKEFLCNKCSNVYTKRHLLYTHYDSIHKEKKFKCDNCNKMFSMKSILRKHYKNHVKNDKMKEIFKDVINDDGSKGFQCITCSSVYEKKGSVRKHFQTVHRENRFKCDKCSKMFPIQSILRYHMKTCSREISETKILKFKLTNVAKFFPKCPY